VDSLLNLFINYFKDVQKLRKENFEMDNFTFNSEYALRICGTNYPLRECLFKAIKESGIAPSKVFVLYKDTQCYRSAAELIKTDKFSSYYEYYTAITTSVSDVRLRNKIENGIKESDCVIVLNTKDCYDIVLNMVKSHSNKILVMVE